MYSIEHKKFLLNIKRRKYIIRTIQVAILIGFIFLWQILSDKNIINSFIASSPKKIIQTITELYKSKNLFHHIFITLYETGISFLLGTFIGCLMATVLWWNPFIARILDPYLTVLNSLPKVSLGPIIIIWAGAGIKSIVLMALLISVIITIINVTQSFNDTDSNKIKLMKSFGASKTQIFFKLILPSNKNTIVSAAKINISMTLIGVIMGEFLVSKQGIGYLIMYGSQVFNLNLVMSGIILLCIMSTLMYYGIVYLEKKIKKLH